MENIQLDGSTDNIENFIKLSYEQQLELVVEQEKQKLKLYTDYMLNCIPLSIRKLKIKDIIQDENKNLILTDEEKNEILDKLSDIINATSKSNNKINKSIDLTTESISSLEINDNTNKNNFRKTKVQLLPISNSCYTIIRDKEENDIENQSILDNNSASNLSVIKDVMNSI